MSINSHGFIADRVEQAVETAFPPYIDTMARIGRERGWPMPTRQQFDFERSPRGAMLLGSPQEVIDKILFEHELFKHDRMMIQFSVGPMQHADIMRSIELFGTQVAPAVRKALGVPAAIATDTPRVLHRKRDYGALLRERLHRIDERAHTGRFSRLDTSDANCEASSVRPPFRAEPLAFSAASSDLLMAAIRVSDSASLRAS